MWTYEIVTLFNEDPIDNATVGFDDQLIQSSEATPPVIAPAAPQAPARSLCPIEAALASRGYMIGSKTNVSLFTSWALERKLAHVDSLREFGAVREVHLYRSRKKPFNHEYILFRFLNAGGVESWLRLERAAQLGQHPYTPSRANLRPLTTGVTAKETASFSTTCGPLSSNSDEVAAMIVTAPFSPSSPQISVEDLSYEIARTQETNRLYQLFTVNCRWFARRLYLNIVQWYQDANIAHEITWRGHTSNSSDISQKLQKEWFGGSRLEGDEGLRLRLQHMLALAVQLLERGDARDVRSLCEDALESLERVNNGSEKDSFLLAYVLVTLGDAIAMMGEPFTALPRLQRACEIMRSLADTRKYFYALTLTRCASALSACGRVQEACDMQGEAVNLTRTLNTLDFELVRDPLAFQLHDLGAYRALLNQYPDACASFEEAIAHRSILYASNPSKNLRLLSITLDHYADALNKSSRSHEAIEASRKAVSLMRLAYLAKPEDLRQDLAGQLYNVANYLRLGDDPEALNAAKEALELRHEMHNIAPTQHRLSLLKSIQQCATICSDLDDVEGAHAHCEEAIKILRELRRESESDTTLRDDLSTTLCNAAYCLAAMKCPQTAADYCKEAIELDRESYLADPTNYHSRLIETLSEYAELLDSMDRDDEASQVRNEVERIRSQ